MSFIEVMITDLCNLTLESGFSDSLNKTLGQYSAGANNTIVNLMKNSVFAVGAALLTLFMLMELVTMVNRANGGENNLPCGFAIIENLWHTRQSKAVRGYT